MEEHEEDKVESATMSVEVVNFLESHQGSGIQVVDNCVSDSRTSEPVN